MNNTWIRGLSIAVVSVVACGLLSVNEMGAQQKVIGESSFSKSLTGGRYILEARDGWVNWCMAPIYDERGKLHVFVSSIPGALNNWTRSSTIVHYTASKPEGPYTLVETTFASDAATYTNPQVSQAGDTCVMVYLWKDASTPGINQQIGIATAKSLDGPWKESSHNPIIRASGIPGAANALHASNPTFLVDADGKYRIYYKSISDKHLPKLYRTISLAAADDIEGPWVNHTDNPLISYEDMKIDIEDPYTFYYKGKYYMIVEDRMGVKNALEGNAIPAEKMKPGGWRAGLIYESEDGIKWDRESPQIGYQTNSHYFNTKLSRTERPHILWKDGEPECLFLTSHGRGTHAGFFLKIENWKQHAGRTLNPKHSPILFGQFLRLHVRATEDVLGVAIRQQLFRPRIAEIVADLHHSGTNVFENRFDDNLVVIKRRGVVAAVHLGDGEEIAAVGFDVVVGDTQ